MFHIPVLAESVLKLLVQNPEGLYVDCTLGTGGHTLKILGGSEDRTRVIGIDRDPAAIRAAVRRLKGYGARVQFFQGNFSDVDMFLTGTLCDGFLLDLGLSSLQMEDPSRGFSYMRDGPLNMAMGGESRSVEEFLASAGEDEIRSVLQDYGEVRRSKMVARSIIERRESKGLERTVHLREAVENAADPRTVYGTLSRVFQAFRIWANRELDNLRSFLPKSVELTRAGGRIAVISYHSLEDRMVKRFFAEEEKGCICPPDFPVCACGRVSRLKVVTRKPIVPSVQEIERNPRSRSAKLRVAERIEDEEKE